MKNSRITFTNTNYLKTILVAVLITVFNSSMMNGQSSRFYPVKTDVYTINLNGDNISFSGNAVAEANVVLAAPVNNSTQQFKFIEQLKDGNSTNFYLIQSVANPEMYLTVDYSRIIEGTNIKLNPRKGENQLWTFKNGAIETALSLNKYIGTLGDNNLVIVDNGPIFNYTKISAPISDPAVIDESTSTYKDHFKINSLNSSEVYTITAKHSNKAIEFSSNDNNSQAVQNTKNQSPSQQFKIIDKGNGFYILKHVNSNKFLQSNSGKVLLSSTSDVDAVLFKLIDNGEGYCSIVSKVDNKAIDVPGSSTSNNTKLIFWGKTGSNNQLFKFDSLPNEDTTITDQPTTTYKDHFKINNLNSSEVYTITAKHSNKAIEFSSNDNNSQAVQNAKNQSPSQQFKIIDKGNGFYILKHVNSNKFLQSNSGKVLLSSTSDVDAVLFKLIDNGKGYCSIVSKVDNKAIDVPGSSTSNNTKLIFWGKTGSNNQLFKFNTLSNGDTVIADEAPISNNTAGTVTFKNMKESFVVEISKLNDENFSKSLGYTQSVSVPTNVGDVYTFSLGDADGFSALPYTVNNLGVTHIIQIGERYTSGKGEKLPNTKASRYSYDIKKVDPVYIDYLGTQAIKDSKNKTIGYGGMRKEIFAPLKNTDIDWYNDDSDYALKNHFTFQNIMESKSSTETKMFYSAAAYQESFSGNIGADTPKGGGSATVSHTSSESDNETNIYTYSRTDVKAYSVSLVENKIALTDEFKIAVMQLPKSYNANAYSNFIKTWGSHYPTKTYYGGVQIAAYKFNASEMMQSESLAVGIQGNVKAASAGGGYSKDETFNQKQSSAKGVHHSKGGTGTGENFAVDFDTSVPVGIDLIRLHELLTSSIFNDGTSESELAIRRNHLKAAITAYIGSPTDNGKPLKPRMYKISNAKWKATKGESDFNVYGKVWIAVMEKQDGDDKKLSIKNVWSRSDAAGARVVAKTNYTASAPGEIIYTVLPKNGSMQLNNYYLRLSSQLADWNKSSSNEDGGWLTASMDLNDISMVPQTIFHDVNFPREETKIRVSATVQEINLGFED